MNMILELIICAVLFILGLTYTFWGYKNLKKLISLGAGLIAFFCAFSITFELGLVPALIISIVFAVMAAILAHFFFAVGIFLIGAGLGLMIGWLITTLIPIDSMILDIVIMVLCCVVFGIIAIKSKRVYLSAATAFTGSTVCCTSLAAIITAIATDFAGMDVVQASLKEHSLLLGIGAAVLGIVGFIIQLAITAPDKNKK